MSFTAGEARSSLNPHVPLRRYHRLRFPLALCSAAFRKGWCRQKEIVLLTFFNEPILRFCASIGYRNPSTRLPGSHKSTLIHGWLSKIVFWGGEEWWPQMPGPPSCWHFCGFLSPPSLAFMGYNWHATTVSFF